MKTKNIFRMLLVAAALLMGANNVKAALPEGENEVWQGWVDCEWGKGAVFSSSLFKNASSGNTVRIYGNFSNGWQTEFMVVNNGWQKFSIPEWGNENKAQASTTTVKSNNNGNYVEFELTTGNLPTIQAVNECVVQGINFTVTKVVIYVASNTSISFGGNVTLTFGDTFTPPTVTTTPANATVTYSTDNDGKKVVYISEDGSTVYPVGEGTAVITGTIQGTSTSATYTITVNKPTAPQGAVWSGAVWLGNFGGDGGSQPRYTIADYLSSAQSGGSIRFYGKIGPLSTTYWKLEIVDPNWTNPRLFAVDANDYTTKTVGGNGFADGYIDIPVDKVNLNGINYIILNGNNLTITAIQVIAPNVQTYTATAAATTNGTVSLNPASAVEGEIVTITATPNSGYQVGSISVTYGNGGSITPESYGNNIYKFAMPASNVTVTVTFSEIVTGQLFDVDMDGYSYRTYVTPYVIDFSRSDEMEGYYAKEVSGNNVVFYQITGKCAAGVPLLLKLTGTNAKLWKVTSENATGVTPSPNLLHAGPYIANGDNIYVLTYHEGQGLNGDGYVFAETEFVSAEVNSSHAYLDLTGVNTARGFKSIKFIKGDTSGINDIEAKTIGSKVVYNLRGQRVEHPTKGIYIINGKKVVMK